MKKKVISRTENVVLNFSYAMFSQAIISLLSLYSRKVFLDYLGEELLGVNSLFADVLTIFSLADLGIVSAITFALYEPIAKGEEEKIKALLCFFKKIYRGIVLLLVLIAISYYPFLDTLKTEIAINDLRIYYSLFVINNIIGYLFVFRETYVVALQQERVLTTINTVFSLLTTIVQIVMIHMFDNYLLFLSLAIFFTLSRKIFTNQYIIRKYPETKVSITYELQKKEKDEIYRKSGSLVVHKIGNLAINQTDGLIISYMISVAQLGIVSNYLVIKSVIANLMSKLYAAILPSVGNFVCQKEKIEQNKMFFLYDFINFWLYDFCFVALSTLCTPFIMLFFGDHLELERKIVYCFFLAFFLDGMRTPVSAFREAKGLYEKDKWYTILAAGVNLISSIIFVRMWGLIGVYCGTILAMLILIIFRAKMLFFQEKDIFIKYMKRLMANMLFAGLSLIITQIICDFLFEKMTLHLGSFIIAVLIVALVPNLFLLCIYRNDENLVGLVNILKKTISNRKA